MPALDPNMLPIPEAFEDDEWNARRNELEAKVEKAARELLAFSQGAAGMRLPFDGLTVTIEAT